MIPAYGETPLPENSGFEAKGNTDGMSTTNDNKRFSRETYELLKQYIDQRKGVGFAAVSGRWKPNKKQYKYKIRPLQFPKSILKEANGEIMYYSYHLTDPDTRVLRKLGAIIPSSKEAKKLMDEWLKAKNGKGQPTLAMETSNSEPGDVISATNCTGKTIIEGTCTTEHPDYGTIYTTCDELQVCDSGGGDSGGDDPWSDSGGGDWDSGGDNTDGDKGDGTGGGDGSVGSGECTETTLTGPCVGSSGYIISSYPEVKYPEGSNYAQKYPKLTEYLKNQLPKLKDNRTIINALEKYGDLSAEKIKEELQWGQGPTIKIKQLDADVYGEFDSHNPNTLFLNIDLVNDLEKTTPGSNLADSFSFLVGVTVLHEYVHYSEYTDGSWNSEESGVLFEKDVYGQTVWRDNASIILKGNGKGSGDTQLR